MKRLILFSIALTFFACNNTKKEVEVPKVSNTDYVQAIYKAFSVGDIETVLAGFTDDIQWNEAENFIYADGNPYVGKDAIVSGVFQRIGEEWEYWNLVDIQTYNVESDKVLATGRYQAKNKANGKILDAQFAHFFTLKDSLISSFQQFADTKQAAEVILVDSNQNSEE